VDHPYSSFLMFLLKEIVSDSSAVAVPSFLKQKYVSREVYFTGTDAYGMVYCNSCNYSSVHKLKFSVLDVELYKISSKDLVKHRCGVSYFYSPVAAVHRFWVCCLCQTADQSG
jgi:ubiquitin C-terminal hydrolase